MGQIVSSAAKPKRCNLNKLSQLGTPAAGEYILVSSDNSMNAAGQGNFECYIVGDGTTAATALELKYLDDSTHPYIVEEVNKAVANIQPIEITGDVTNAPDEEDLTSENQGGTDVLKFKDKAYNAALYSGLGRVYLRKNIVTLEGTGKNVLTQAMINTANTIYHIQYDYDLNGQTITMPAGCVLEFDGGSVKNGKLVANGAKVISDGAAFNCEVENIGNDETHLQWFIFGDDKQSFLRASKCARSSQGNWLNGDFISLEITGSVSITEDNDCNLKNVVVDYTATANKESMFLYNTSRKYLAAMTTMENCTFTMLNYTDFSDVHCIHFRLYDLTVRGKFSHVYVKNFTGFMFICESYLQETMFEDFRGNRVGGFISFNKEYGTENAYGDFAAGSSNILSFKQCGIDNYLGHNTTIRDVVDITRLIYVYMESCVFQGAVTGQRLSDNCYNFTRYNDKYSAKVVIFNCWVEFSGQTQVPNRCTIGEGMHIINKSERFANTWTVDGAYCCIETPFMRMDNGNIFTISEGAMPTIKFTGTGSLRNTGFPVKFLKDIANISFDVAAARSIANTQQNEFYYKPCEYHDQIPDIEQIISDEYANATKQLISVQGARVLRQIPTSTNPKIFFINRTDWIMATTPRYNGVYHLVYRVYPLVEVTEENLSEFDRAGLDGFYDEFIGGGSNPFEVGQSLVPEENEWREVIVGAPQNIYINYKNSAGKWAMDIAVCESYTTNFNVVRKIFPDPSDATKLVVLEPYDGFENILVGELHLTSGTTLNTNNSRIPFPLKAGTHFVYFDTGGVITDSTMYFRDEADAAIPFSYRGVAQTRTNIPTGNLGNPVYQPLTITKDVSYVNFYGGTASADGTIKVWVVLDKLKSYKDKIKELEDRINALEQSSAS